MKRGLAVAAVMAAWGWFGAAPVDAAGLPNPNMNRHYPYYITSSYWTCGGFGIAGPTDVIWPCPQPVNGIGPPPFGPRPQHPPMYCPPQQCPPQQCPPQQCPPQQCPPQAGVPYYYYPGGTAAQQPPPIVWSRFVRSPRDFFMVDVGR